MRRKSLEGAECPIARSLDVIGDWWSLLLVRDALRGVRRFSAFQKNLGVSKNILARRLRGLVAHGILELVPAAEGGTHQEYALTEKGRGLLPVIAALGQWGAERLFTADQCRMTMVDRETGQPVRRLRLRAQDGRRLAPEDIAVKRLEPPAGGAAGPAAATRGEGARGATGRR